MSFWKEAGLTYLQYANVTARALRSVVKDELKVNVLRREEQYAKHAKWNVGKQQEMRVIQEYTPPAIPIKQ